MSLDNIQLPSIVLQNLFKNSLIELNSSKAEKPSNNNAGISYLGTNKKNVSIIVEDVSTIYLPDEQLNFLIGILSACKLSMAEVALINSAKYPALNYQTLDTELNPAIILLFGVSPKQLDLPLEFPQYQIQKFNNQTYLSAPDLAVLQGDKAEKTKLWNCLKQVFSIN
jgi:hypothetical protein